jgi:asparagine synthetase B (glutamine-hydrolysing)
MCGIFFSLSRDGYVTPDTNTKRLLQNRGPDSTGQYQTTMEKTYITSDENASFQVHATFLSTVLALRGKDVVEQPLRDDATGSALCWKGEAWSIAGDVVNGNDSQLVFAKLIEACNVEHAYESTHKVVDVLSSIRGPYALVFYDARNQCIYYGRDCLGRRSLLRKSTSDGSLVLSSVCDNASGEAWREVEADGMFVVDFKSQARTSALFAGSHASFGRADAVRVPRWSIVGRPSGMRVSLTQTDNTLPSLEPQRIHQSLFSKSWSSRSIEGFS